MNDMAKMPEVPAVEVKGGLTAYLQVDGAQKAAEFYKKAFDAEIAVMMPADEQGRTMHLHLYINGSSLMLSDPYPEHGMPAVTPQGYSVVFNLTNDDIDAWYQRAVDAGCEVKTPLQIMFWGDRYADMVDPFGVRWAMNARMPKA
ncbi:VOC family protein [Mesorhizobium sp. NBSH29]|uniref:VOC family protein n=1 Tax=Mesorhizobium sp. NBSH29 TaxID=2654249 RepID=UPI001896694F|nr:VOC family protein [Mesorhizobium sp. NBSH29]QPC88404.1 VOC family protein [Mesorhizobium sp. NBSH29]